MREIVRAGITLQKFQPRVCWLQWMGQQLTIESRGTRSFTAYTVEREECSLRMAAFHRC